jgi:hypothetical protein
VWGEGASCAKGRLRLSRWRREGWRERGGERRDGVGLGGSFWADVFVLTVMVGGVSEAERLLMRSGGGCRRVDRAACRGCGRVERGRRCWSRWVDTERGGRGRSRDCAEEELMEGNGREGSEVLGCWENDGR